MVFSGRELLKEIHKTVGWSNIFKLSLICKLNYKFNFCILSSFQIHKVTLM